MNLDFGRSTVIEDNYFVDLLAVFDNLDIRRVDTVQLGRMLKDLAYPEFLIKFYPDSGTFKNKFVSYDILAFPIVLPLLEIEKKETVDSR